MDNTFVLNMLVYTNCLVVGRWWCVILKLVMKTYNEPTNLFFLSGRNWSTSTAIIPRNDNHFDSGY